MSSAEARPAPHDPDALFVRLVRAHRDLSPEESRRLDAALVLLLVEALGDPARLEAAIAAARTALGKPVEPPEELRE
jgi:predicted phosphoribosyltransferase